MSHTVTDLTAPLPLTSWNGLRFALMRFGLNTVGRLSKGIRIGRTYGFDSGVMLDHVYENRAEGHTVLGRLIDRNFLDAPGWVGIRNRGDLLRRAVISEVTAIRAEGSGHEVVVVDLACGGGRYLLGALDALRPGAPVRAVLRDYRDENVAKATRNAERLGLVVTTERADAFSDRDLAALPRPDLVVVSGLHEIIPDDVPVQNHFGQIARLLPRGGRLLVTVQPDHPQLELIARVLTSHSGRPWAMRLRSVALIRAWAEAAGFAVENLTMEPTGIFGLLTLRKA